MVEVTIFTCVGVKIRLALHDIAGLVEKTRANASDLRSYSIQLSVVAVVELEDDSLLRF